jgi:hypothetical protein
MLFCQLGRADSLREICNGLGCCLGRLVHVGIARAPCRSTLSYANEHRPAALFEDLFFTALARFREQQGLGTRKHKFRFKNKLLSLDSTTISLCLTMFPWAKFRRAKGGVKAHVLLDHDDYLPAYVLLTEAKRSDVKLADSFRLNPGSIVAIDRGYIDYALFARWSISGVFFVTRLKDNAAFHEKTIPCQAKKSSSVLDLAVPGTANGCTILFDPLNKIAADRPPCAFPMPDSLAGSASLPFVLTLLA